MAHSFIKIILLTLSTEQNIYLNMHLKTPLFVHHARINGDHGKL